MQKNSKNREQFFDMLNHMHAIVDFVELVAGMSASINLKYNEKDLLTAPPHSSALVNNLVTKYNSITSIHYIDSYKGTIKSTKKRDRKTYLRRFKEKLYRTVDFRYSCGHAVATLTYKDVVDALDIFFDLLNI